MKEIGFNGSAPLYPEEEVWKYDAQHDLNLSVTGIPGQNTPTPASKLFNLHYVYLVGQTGGPYYDPSYGVTYEDESDFTSKAIAAWAKVIDGQVHWCKAEDQPNAVVEFN